jgi:ubiquinone/menaquinone biosynthesis C-methylase UbiE
LKYDFYDREEYYKPKIAFKVRNILHRRLLKNILPPKKALEIGVGFGEFAHFCRDNRIDYLGIEPNTKLREKLKEEGFQVLDGLLPRIPELQRKFDLVFLGHIIEHLKDYSEVLESLENLKNVLNKDGYLILLYPEVTKTRWLFYHDYTHSYPTSIRRVEALLKDSGYRVIESHNYVSFIVKGAWLFYCLGKIFPYFLFGKQRRYFWRLSFSMNSFTVAQSKE